MQCCRVQNVAFHRMSPLASCVLAPPISLAFGLESPYVVLPGLEFAVKTMLALNFGVILLASDGWGCRHNTESG